MSTSFVVSNNSITAFEVEALPNNPAPQASEPMARIGALLDGLQEAACVVDEDLRVQEWNAAMSRLTGLPKNQALWQPLFTLFPRNFKQALADKCRQVLERQETQELAAPESPSAWEGDIQQLHGRDVFLTFRYRLSALEVDQRRPLALLSLCEVRHERMLKKQFDYREQLNLLGMLSAGVAQELTGALDLICHKLDDILKAAKEAGNATLAEDLEEIMPQVYRIGYLTNNVVSLGRDVAPQLVYLNVNEALQEALFFLEQTQKRKISCAMALTPSLPLIAADPILLQIVFQNVMKYALEAAGEDVVPRVHTTMSTDQEGILIHLQDRGPQVDEEILANFFDPAYTSPRWGLAIGLGLLLAKKIVEAHNGSLEVSSLADHGTKLTIFLPVMGHSQL